MSSASSLTASLSALATQYQSSLVAQKVAPVQSKQAALTSQVSALGTLKSYLSSLNDASTAMAKTDSNSKFLVYSAASSNSDVLAATASSTSVPGTHSIHVDQLAKADVVISSRFTSASTSIDTAEMTADEKTAGTATRQFKISIGGSEKATVGVTLTGGPSDTNSAVLSKIASAINASSDASQYVSASVVAVTPTQSRLVITDLATGSTNAVSLSDVGPGTLLENIGMGAGVISGRTAIPVGMTPDDPLGTPGGYLISGDSSQLDSKFNVDGIDIIRTTNNVTDVLAGVTFQLKMQQAATDAPMTLTVGTDKTQVKSNLQQFLNTYNNVIGYIKSQTAIDPKTGQRQQFAFDTSVKGIRNSLRSMMSSAVSGLAGGSNLLSNIGITAGSDGTLSITDSTKLDTALTANPKTVSDIFNSSQGLAVNLKTYLDPYTKSGGSFDNQSISISNQIKSLSKKITDLNSQIAIQVKIYKDEFAKLEAVYTQANSQLNLLGQILGTTSIGG